MQWTCNDTKIGHTSGIRNRDAAQPSVAFDARRGRRQGSLSSKAGTGASDSCGVVVRLFSEVTS